MKKEILGILCSGNGSNLQAILDAIQRGELETTVGIVLSDNPKAVALQRAQKAGVPYVCVNRKSYATREAFEAALLKELQAHKVTVVILAGFMRILSGQFVQAYRNKILNLHPSLLPSFVGAHAYQDALAYGAKVTGCTVHFVDENLDAGPIILQKAVPIHEDDTPETLIARIHEQEHLLFPKAIALLLADKLRIEGRRVHILP